MGNDEGDGQTGMTNEVADGKMTTAKLTFRQKNLAQNTRRKKRREKEGIFIHQSENTSREE